MKKVFFLLLIIVLIVFLLSNMKSKDIISCDNLKTFHFSYSNGYGKDDNVSYDISNNNDEYILTIKPFGKDEETNIILTDDDIKKIIDVLVKYNVNTWNGFNKSDKNVLDGDSFSFYYINKDKEEIRASGYMRYPNNYGNVEKELESIFNALYKE